MTEEQIKLMLKDIIDNGAEYEFSYQYLTGDYSPWTEYRLGYAINSNFVYRKVEKYAVAKFVDEYSVGLKSALSKNATIYFESTSKEACEKWVKEHTKTWFVDYLKLFPKESQKETCKIVCKEVCKKILEEVKLAENRLGSIVYKDVEDVIKDLGVKI